MTTINRVKLKKDLENKYGNITENQMSQELGLVNSTYHRLMKGANYFNTLISICQSADLDIKDYLN